MSETRSMRKLPCRQHFCNVPGPFGSEVVFRKIERNQRPTGCPEKKVIGLCYKSEVPKPFYLLVSSPAASNRAPFGPNPQSDTSNAVIALCVVWEYAW